MLISNKKLQTIQEDSCNLFTDSILIVTVIKSANLLYTNNCALYYGSLHYWLNVKIYVSLLLYFDIQFIKKTVSH